MNRVSVNCVTTEHLIEENNYSKKKHRNRPRASVGSLIISNDFGSTEIEDALTSYSTSTFIIEVDYEQRNRGQDYWYEAQDIDVTPFWGIPH